MEHYDIFISYRRDGGFETAKHLNDLLVYDGYTVSFDIDTLREGDFDETLLKRIDQCVDFILVVDKHTFDRTLDPEFDPKKDWLRTELAYALKLKKNIIPVLLSGVNGFPTNLPEDVADVATKNGPEYNKYYFDEFYRRLKSFLHCVPRNAKIEDKDYATITLYSDSDASVSSDGEHIANVKAKEFTKVQVPLGEHVFEYVSIQDSSRRYSEVHALNEVKNYVIQIKLEKQKFPIKTSLLLKIVLGVVIAAAIIWGVYKVNKTEPSKDQIEKSVKDPTIENWTKYGGFNEGLASVKNDSGRTGFIDTMGNLVINCEWKRAGCFNEGLAAVENDNGLWGFIDKTGNFAIPCKWKNAWGFSEGLARVIDYTERSGFIDKRGELVIPCTWRETGSFSGGIAYVLNDDKLYGFIGKNGNEIIPCKWNRIHHFSEGLIAVQDDNGKWGFIDKTGRIVIPCKWKDTWAFYEGLACVKDSNDNWGYIDMNGNVVISCKWKNAFNFKHGKACVWDDNGKSLYINKTGKIIQ